MVYERNLDDLIKWEGLMNSQFSAHGKLEISVEGRILIVKGIDSPNSEMVDEFALTVEAYIQSLKGAPWGCLTHLHGDAIFPPSALPMIEANLKRMASLGLVGIATIIEHSESPSVVKQFWQSMYEKSAIAYQFFDQSEGARSWLLNKITHDTLSAEDSLSNME